jgi:RimJ/RimL family protein N-acetyltransferase
MTLPTLETPRLRLRPRLLADLEACFRMDREPGTLDWIEWPETAGGWDDPAAHRAFIRARIGADYPEGMGYWVLARRERPGEFLGWVLLIPADAAGPGIEIGWRLTGAARGLGLATEAARRVLEHALNGLGLDRVIADIHARNAASIGVARKIGMHATGPPPGAPHLVRYEARACGRN